MIEWDEPHYTKEEEAEDRFYDENGEAVGEEIKAEMIEEGKDPEGTDEAEWEERTQKRLEEEWQKLLDEAADMEADRYMTYRYGYDY